MTTPAATLIAAARADATATPAEAAATARARAAWHRVMNAEWPGDGDAIRAALDGTAEALETYTLLLTEDLHPASAYCELEHEDDAYDRALAMTAEDAADWAGELDRLVPEEAEGERAA